MAKRLDPIRSPATTTSGGGALSAPKRVGRGPGPTDPPKRKRSFWRRVWIWTQVVMAVVIISLCVAGYFIYQQGLIYYGRAEKIDLNKLNDVSVTSTFLDANGDELGRIFVEDRVILKPEQIPQVMREAVMAAEDRRFYEHGAIDYWGILRALHENMGKKNKVQGGSSIEQQLAKHLIGDFSRTLDRKFLEAFVALRLERHYTKDEILNYYMNRIYFGKGYFGIGAAARGYFGKDDAMQLTLPECALLAGIIRAPTSSSPRVDIGKAKWRRDLTLRQMLDEKFITHEEYARAVGTPIHIIPAKPAGLQTFVMAAAVKEMEQILSIEGTEEMPQGLTVRTNINLRLQHAVEDQVNAHLAAIESAGDTTPSVPAVNPSMAPARPLLQGSALVADLSTGRVLAWVGGRDFLKNQFDHVSMARRENGALLQPLIYSLGFDKLGLSPASMINASYIDPTVPATAADLALGNPNTDLTKRFLSIQDALALGNKAAATRVGLQLGARNVTDWLKRAGADQARIPDDKPNVFNPDPMTLGDIASLYQVLGNDGIHRKLKIIQSIESKTGQILYEDSKNDSQQDQLLDIVNDEQMTLTMQNSLRSGFARTLARDYGFKTPISGMPGYSEGYRDAWFVGYTPQVLAAVWVGYDDSRPIGSKDVAVRSAVPLWGDVMRETVSRVAAGTAFPEPASLSKVEIDRTTGALRGLAGLAPAPDDIFVYLKKEQIDAAGGAGSPQQIEAPKEWSDWLTTMFNDADETGISPDQVLGPEDKRSNIIPALAEYKMPALRGDILSSDGNVYATMTNQENLVVKWPAAGDATADADIVAWMRARLDEANKAIGVTVTITDADLLAQYRTQRYQPFTVEEDITPAQADMIRSAGLEAKGFSFVGTPRRIYPRGSELAHVLGYLSRDQQRNKGKYLSGDVIYDRYRGASGLEQVFNQDLIGQEGRFMISTTPDGYARSAAVAQPPTYGNNLRLTIDSKIQASVEKALNRKRMDAFVLMDVHNGDIIAMASHPTFDPNIFLPTIASDEWQMLNTDKFNPLLNRAIDAQFPPGSCFKTVTSIAAMVAGVFDPNWIVHCTGYFDIGDMHMNLKEEAGHDVSYKEALTHSFNTYFATLGLKVGRDVLLDTARSFNFGNPTGISLPGELPGNIPDSEFVRRVHQRDFGPGDVVNTAIGQGDVLVTPIQMADFMASLANGGTMYRPRLVKQIEDRNGKVVREIPTDTLRTIALNSPFMANLKEGMINVIDEGTATVVHRDDMKIAAKTGTAQVGTKEHPRQVAWLCGYLPADNPQYSFAVMVQGEDSDNHGLGLDDGLLGGREGGAIASHVFDDVFGLPPNAKRRSEEYEDYDKAPDLTSPPKVATDDADSDADGADAAAKVPPPAPPKKTTPDDDDAAAMGTRNGPNDRDTFSSRASSTSSKH